MKWTEAKVIFEHGDKQIAADLISDIFNDFGLQGVVIEDPEADPVEGWGAGAVEPKQRANSPPLSAGLASEFKTDSIPYGRRFSAACSGELQKPANNSVTGYFPSNSSLSDKCLKLEKKLKDLESKSGISWQIAYSEIDEMDWAESWKSFFWPEKIGEKIVVKPTWREYTPEKDDIILEIDPGMAFGTGAHPTSALCLRMIEKHLKPGDSFLDIGTGSGILMIAAAKLGAKRLMGTDTDEVAAEIARSNLLLNNIDENRFAIQVSSLTEKIEDRFDIVAANILSEVIMTLLDTVRDVISENGMLICSGIIEENRIMVEKKMKEKGFEIIETQVREGWVCIAGRLSALAGEMGLDRAF